MDYGLAKELKDAGFPIKDLCRVTQYATGNNGEYECAYTELPAFESGSYSSLYPTLSELIEACGEHFESLVKIKTNDGYEWKSRGYNYPNNGCKTPEEAVARLWLALNKK